MACSKCGKPLVKADRGNITLGNPDGFDHIDCAKSQYLGRDMRVPDRVYNDELIASPASVEDVPEWEAVKDDSVDKVIEPTLNDSETLKEKEEERDGVIKPIKKGGRDSVFKRRLS